MKVFWLSNAPYAATGYGSQTGIFLLLMKQAGWEVQCRTNWGHFNTVLTAHDIPIWPMSPDGLAQDTLRYDWERHQPDVYVILYDMWPFRREALQQIPVSAWAPVDGQPIAPAVADALAQCRWVWAMSRHGEREMRRAGLDPFYVPHGVETGVYKPVDRTKAREQFDVDGDTLLVAVNAANRDFPSRKSFDKILKAWGRFVTEHPKALLYLHTNVTSSQRGADLGQMAEFYNVPEGSIRHSVPEKMRDGEYPDEWINLLYNAADVLLLPSMGEGFGLPALEAQSAGCPAIVSDFSAQAELGEAGYRIPIDPFDDRFYNPQGVEWASPRPSEIIKALDWALEHKGDTGLRAQAREFAMEYDATRVFERFMQPSLQIMAAGNAELKPHPQPFPIAMGKGASLNGAKKPAEVGELVSA